MTGRKLRAANSLLLLTLPLIRWAVLFVCFGWRRQNFPLDDDWCYARGLFAFLHGEGIHYFDWAAMPQLGQWLWASGFVYLLGESHVALRLSTMVLGGLGGLAFFDLLRQGELPGPQAAFAAA